MWWVNDVLYLPPPNVMLSRYLLLFLIPIEGLNYFSYHLDIITISLSLLGEGYFS